MQNRIEISIELAKIPGVAVVRTSSSGEMITQVAGVTNKLSPHAVTEDTVFEAASLSKPVFAYLVIKMAERGKIDLDVPLFKYVPETGFGPEKMRSHDNYKLLTARMILSHQAGLPNEFLSEESEKYISKAGEKFDYSGEAYQFLSEVIEKISGKSIEMLAQKEFKKIGMTNSSFMPPTGCCLIRLPDESPEPTGKSIKELLKNSTDKHAQLSIILHQNKLFVAERDRDGTIEISEKNSSQVGKENFHKIKARFNQIPEFFWSKPIPVEAREIPLMTAIVGHSPKHAALLALGHHRDGTVNDVQRFYKINPAGSLYTTAADYGRFLRELARDQFVRKEMFGMKSSSETQEEMFNPVVPSLAGKDSKSENLVPLGVLKQLAWGVGIGLQRNPDGSFIAFHWGDNKTGRNFAAIHLSTHQAVACFTNSKNGPLIFQEIAEPVVGSITPITQWLHYREGLIFNSTSRFKDALVKTRSTMEEESAVINKTTPF